MQPPVLVRHVNHLTDARYFGAAGVDWISLDVSADTESFARFQAIRDWVEGVRFAVEPVTPDEELLARILIELKPEGIILDPSVETDLPADVQLFRPVTTGDATFTGEAARIIPLASLGSVRAGTHQDFLEADWTADAIARLIDEGYSGGFCLHGSVEEQTGVKDFTRLDEVMDVLRP